MNNVTKQEIKNSEDEQRYIGGLLSKRAMGKPLSNSEKRALAYSPFGDGQRFLPTGICGLRD